MDLRPSGIWEQQQAARRFGWGLEKIMCVQEVLSQSLALNKCSINLSSQPVMNLDSPVKSSSWENFLSVYWTEQVRDSHL